MFKNTALFGFLGLVLGSSSSLIYLSLVVEEEPSTYVEQFIIGTEIFIIIFGLIGYKLDKTELNRKVDFIRNKNYV